MEKSAYQVLYEDVYNLADNFIRLYKENNKVEYLDFGISILRTLVKKFPEVHSQGTTTAQGTCSLSTDWLDHASFRQVIDLLKTDVDDPVAIQAIHEVLECTVTSNSNVEPVIKCKS